jgi:hypothetical protein
MSFSPSKRLIGLIGIAAVGAGAFSLSVVRSDDTDDKADKRPSVIIGQGKEAVPATTPEDWLSFGDHAAVVQVASETAQTPSAEEKAAGEGYIGRTVQMNVKKIIWSRKDAAALPTAVTMEVDGWSFKGSVKTPIAQEGAARIEPGHTYIVNLAKFADGSWGSIGSDAALPYDNSIIGNGEVESQTVSVRRSISALAWIGEDPDLDAPVKDTTSGMTDTAVKDLLVLAKPDPVAVANATQDPVTRAETVAGAKTPSAYCAAAEPFNAASNSELSATELADYLEVLVSYETGDTATQFNTVISYFRGTTTTDPVAAKTAVANRIHTQCGFTVRSWTPNPAPSPTESIG